MILHKHVSRTEFINLVRNKKILWAGNVLQKIYGSLHCTSGKRLKKNNRIFFTSESEAIDFGYRPCGHCMPTEYRQWKLARNGLT